MKRKLINFTGIILAAVIGHSNSNAIEVVFQSDGSDSSIFTNLTVTGDVNFNTPLAKVFGRDTSLNALPDQERFVNDFRGTLADEDFLNSSSEFHELNGVVFGLGEFNNSDYPNDLKVFSGIRWTVDIPEQLGLVNRRVNIQFGKGQNAAAQAQIKANGRQAVLRVRKNIPLGLKNWGQWINNQRFTDINDAKKAVRAEAAARNKLALGDPRLDLYEALLDGSKWVDPIENFYIDLVNDNGGAFQLELDITFANDLFLSTAQFLDYITVEIGEEIEFSNVYNDVENQTFIGTTPFNLDLSSPGNGSGGMQSIQIVSADFIGVPEPNSLVLIGFGLISMSLSRQKNKHKK